jgi:hypothetical protein
MINERTAAKPKPLFKVEFWEENKEREPVLVRYIHAYSPAQAKMMLRERATQDAKINGNFLVAHMFVRNDISVIAKEVKENPIKERIRQETKNAVICPRCSGRVEDDLCQNCGWNRESWWDRGNRDAGKQQASGEQLELNINVPRR